eukprot:2176678-Lingulodinium_polyedra.AAC.1
MPGTAPKGMPCQQAYRLSAGRLLVPRHAFSANAGHEVWRRPFGHAALAGAFRSLVPRRALGAGAGHE